MSEGQLVPAESERVPSLVQAQVSWEVRDVPRCYLPSRSHSTHFLTPLFPHELWCLGFEVVSDCSRDSWNWVIEESRIPGDWMMRQTLCFPESLNDWFPRRDFSSDYPPGSHEELGREVLEQVLSYDLGFFLPAYSKLNSALGTFCTLMVSPAA